MLVLVRHSKAQQEGASDFVRELAPRGLRDAAVAGQWLRDAEIMPDLAVVSPATRAVQTWAAMAAAASSTCPVHNDRGIYDGGVEDLLAIVCGAAEEHRTLALVGHNPTIHALAHDLDDSRGEAKARAEIARSFPTSGIAVFDVDGPWADLSPRGATLRRFVVPRG